MLTLIIFHPETGERRIELAERSLHDDGVVLGRSVRAQVMIDELSVSRIHARLCILHGAIYVEDLASSAGTIVNGRRLLPHQPLRLAKGDELVLGACRLVVAQADGGGGSEEVRLNRPPSVVDYMPVADMDLTAPPRWTAGEREVRVVRVVAETADVKTFVLATDPPELFIYQPGQCVVVQANIAGQTVRRTYTLSSSPSRPHLLSITVKRHPAAAPGQPPGVMSNWLHDVVKTGDPLTISGPHGSFSCLHHADPRLLLVSAGSGITPMLSMARWLIDTGATVDTAFVHWARTSRDFIARHELEWLAAQDACLRVTLVTTRPEPGGWTGLSGHADLGLLRLAVPDLTHRRVFCCGPDPFMRTVREALLGAGLPADHFHQESFGVRRWPVPAPSPEAPTPPLGAPIVPPPPSTVR